MTSILTLLGLGFVGAVCVFFLGGLVHLRHSIRVASQRIEEVTLEEIPGLREDCIDVFFSAFRDRLDLEDFEGSAMTLSGRLDDENALKTAFAEDDFYWHFVLPVGAFMGELLRVHLNGEWRASELGGLEIAIPVGDEQARTFPFHKVLKHVTSGDPGDIFAYFAASKQLDKAIEQAAG